MAWIIIAATELVAFARVLSRTENTLGAVLNDDEKLAGIETIRAKKLLVVLKIMS